MLTNVTKEPNLVPVNCSEEGGIVVSTEWLLHKKKIT